MASFTGGYRTTIRIILHTVPVRPGFSPYLFHNLASGACKCGKIPRRTWPGQPSENRLRQLHATGNLRTGPDGSQPYARSLAGHGDESTRARQRQVLCHERSLSIGGAGQVGLASLRTRSPRDSAKGENHHPLRPSPAKRRAQRTERKEMYECHQNATPRGSSVTKVIVGDGHVVHLARKYDQKASGRFAIG